MNDFKQRIKVDRTNSGEIIITEELKNVLIHLMKNDISKKEAMELTGIGDKGTVEIKMQELINMNPNLMNLYNEYIARKSKNFEGYTFRREAIDMLRNDISQSHMAEYIGVNRRTFSTKMKNLQEDNKNNELGKLLQEHANRKMKRKTITLMEQAKINYILDEYEENYPVGNAKYENKDFIETRFKTIAEMLNTVNDLINEGNTIKELSENKIISESSYRKYKIEAENLKKILNEENSVKTNNENEAR